MAMVKNILFAVGVILLTVVTWLGLNGARVVYADWAFLHQARLFNEQQAKQPAQQAPTPGK